MDVAIVTVNFRSKDHVENMIESAYKHLKVVSWEIIVVNNDVNEDLSDLESENVRIINQENLGFASGCNLGIQLSSSTYVALINPDVVFVDDSLTEVVRRMDKDIDVGIAGVRLEYMDGSPQASVRRFPGIWDQLLVMLKVPHVIKNIPAIARYHHADLDVNQTQDVDQVMGAYFVIRRDLIDAIGPMDDGYFFWFEEVDYCRRAKDAGWKIRYYADIVAKHAQAGSFSRVKTLRKQNVIRKSLRRYMRKHHGIKGWLVFVLMDPVFRMLAVVAALLKRY